MSHFVYESQLPVSAEEAFAWHARAGAFQRLTPPWEDIRVIRPAAGIRDGATQIMELRKGPIRTRWVARHRDYEQGRRFADEQIEGPFASWLHTHRFLPVSEDSSVLEDSIEYELPLGALGSLVAGGPVERRLQRTFRWRHRRTALDLARHRTFAQRPRRRIVISGASGLIGSTLTSFLSGGGHQVERLVRRRPVREGEIFWRPARGEIDAAELEEADAVVHLSGENLAAGRWTRGRKRAIRASRVESTRLLARTLAELRRPPRTLVVASGVGYYGDAGDRVLSEDSPRGSGFLAELCGEWEAAADAAREAGIRVVHLRAGVVLTPSGGALAKMLTPFRLGLGGRIGDGEQYISWISLEDMIGLVNHVLMTPALEGPVNAVSPRPVTNREFTDALGAVLGRPTPFVVPASAVRLALGEMGTETLLASQRAEPSKLARSGFTFAYPELDAALDWELGILEPSS